MWVAALTVRADGGRGRRCSKARAWITWISGQTFRASEPRMLRFTPLALACNVHRSWLSSLSALS